MFLITDFIYLKGREFLPTFHSPNTYKYLGLGQDESQSMSGREIHSSSHSLWPPSKCIDRELELEAEAKTLKPSILVYGMKAFPVAS